MNLKFNCRDIEYAGDYKLVISLLQGATEGTLNFSQNLRIGEIAALMQLE